MRAVVYTRQSLDRHGDGLAVARQREDAHKLCAERGWQVTETVTDNDVSASNGKPRPGFLRVLAMVDARQVDVVVVWHVDRLVRKLTELEDVIARVERAGVKIATVSGDIDLSTDAGRLVGRILALVARGEVERKSARQRRALLQAAESGKPKRWTHRPFGYHDDKQTPVPTEAAAVAAACEQLLSGGSLRSVTRQWNTAGLTPPQRSTTCWRATTVRTVLLNPRIAGLSTYRGEVVGAGTWPPLVTEQTWRAVHALLTDPGRRVPRGVRTLLGGLARCHCGAHVYGGNNSRGRRIYRCIALPGGGGGHVARLAEPVEDYVSMIVIERLSRPDAADLLIDRDAPDVEALRAETRALRARLEEIAREFADGAIPAGMVRTMTERVQTRLAETDAAMADAGRVSVLGHLVGAEDVRAVWDELDNDRKRAVVDALMTVTLHSPGRGARVFHPATVKITPREQRQ
ncbi:MAG: recombinase family protein [Actinomycetota bacterium]|nr:recombinase family protein [Actinomycetota bacterium]